jgi:hypothetical protein
LRSLGLRVAYGHAWVAFLHDPHRLVRGEEGAHLSEGTGRSKLDARNPCRFEQIIESATELRLTCYHFTDILELVSQGIGSSRWPHFTHDSRTAGSKSK